jgi:hypothetical protein
VTQPASAWRSIWRALALALVIAVVPLPALAGDTSQPIARPSIRASAAKVVATARLADSNGQAAQEGKAELNKPSFFRTPAGVVVLAVVVGGTGYAIYSARHDRIHSVVRSGQ